MHRPGVSEPSLREVSREQSSPPVQFVETLLTDLQPFEGVAWKTPAAELGEEERLERLARIKALLPPDNAIAEKTTHDVTLENYIRLALHAAGDRATLDTFLSRAHFVLENLPADETQSLAQQVFWIWAPAAEVAGLYQHKVALEELAFQVLLPEEYAAVAASYDKERLEGNDGQLAHLSAEIEWLLQQTAEPGVTWQIAARPKSYYSVWRKLRSEDRTVAQLFDLIGIRVIIDGQGDEAKAVQQCYAVMVDAASLFESDRSRLKDYIETPKPNGYRSLHLTLYTPAGMPFELQLRTIAMHEAAETDSLLSHQGYDAAFKETPGKISRVYRKVPKVYRWRDEATALIQERGGDMGETLQDEVLFFREDGNLYRLPAGANMLDASFRIHNRRALRTRGIRTVDGQPLQFSRLIQLGDAITVECGPDYPTQAHRFDTLRVATNLPESHKAIERGRRTALAEQLQQQGRHIVLSMIGEVGVQDPFSLLTDEDKKTLIHRTGLPSFDKLLEIIGAGERSGKPSRIVRLIHTRLGIGDMVEPPLKERVLRAVDNQTVLNAIEVPGVDNVAHSCKVAGCCSERIIPGEAVVARASRLDDDGALKVHRLACKNIRDTEDLLTCNWHTVDS